MHVRLAQVHDLTDVAAIHAHYMQFSDTIPDDPPEEHPTDFVQLFHRLRALGLPFLVAVNSVSEGGDEVAGYAYAVPYQTGAAYRYTVEDKICVDHRWCGLGIGRMLLDSLIEDLRRTPVRQIIATIPTMPHQPWTTQVAGRMHHSAGYALCGRLNSVGIQSGAFFDMVYFQLGLDGYGVTPLRA